MSGRCKVFVIFARAVRQGSSNARVWAVVKGRWPELEPKVTIFGGDTRVGGGTSSFCDAGVRGDIKAFFTAHPLPEFPASGMEAPANQSAIPGTRVLEQGWAIPGPDSSTYAFVKTELQRNLYRIPLH